LCPGIHLAERSFFVALAKIIWAFDILPPRDTTGKVIENDMSWETGFEGGIIVNARPFACELQLRSEKRKETIFREFSEAEQNLFPTYLVPSK
jgi:cytochrome P450 family 619